MNTKVLPPLDPLQRYTVNEACDYLRISRSYLYKLIKTGKLPTVDDGRRTYVPGQAIAERSSIAA